MSTSNSGIQDSLGFQQERSTLKILDRCKLLTFLTVFDNEMIGLLLILSLSLRLVAIPSASGCDSQI